MIALLKRRGHLAAGGHSRSTSEDRKLRRPPLCPGLVRVCRVALAGVLGAMALIGGGGGQAHASAGCTALNRTLNYPGTDTAFGSRFLRGDTITISLTSLTTGTGWISLFNASTGVYLATLKEPVPEICTGR